MYFNYLYFQQENYLKSMKEESHRGFRLIGIRPILKIEEEFIEYSTPYTTPIWRKNLVPNLYYSFYDDIKPNNSYYDPNNFKEIDSFSYDENKKFTNSLYNINNLNINVSAIVGKNGSGKSALLEMFYAFCYCISKDMHNNKKIVRKLKLENRLLLIEQGLNVEVFFEMNEKIFSIRYLNSEIYYFEYTNGREKSEKMNVKFPYTIALNYSLYGLNDIINPWLKPLFHKNDGYKTPLVINPMRDNGQIDLNKEFLLSQTRILNNLTDITKNEIELVEGKIIKDISFEISPISLDKLYTIDNEIKTDSLFNVHMIKHNESIYSLFNRFVNVLYDQGERPFINIDKINKTLLNQQEIEGYIENDKKGLKNLLNEFYSRNRMAGFDNDISTKFVKYWIVKYVLKKIFKICLTYSGYKSFLDKKSISKTPYFNIPSQDNNSKTLNNLLIKLAKDNSHVTDKLKQAITSIELLSFEVPSMIFEKISFYYLEDKSTTISELITSFKVVTTLDIFDYIEFMKTERMESRYLQKKHYILGGFFKHKLNVVSVKNLVSNKWESYTAQNMSSGEQHLFQKINTVIYHLRNIESLSERNKHEFVNIIFDEVELYFHPEYQRNFINILLNYISLFEFNQIKHLNLIFSTHSPFILSDIPSTNILRLIEGNPEPDQGQTFGANIHDLLANDFFLKDGFMGEFAKEWIEDLILFLRYNPETKETKDNKSPKKEWTELKAKQIISIVGEPILKIKLAEMFDRKFKQTIEIELLKKRISELENFNK